MASNQLDITADILNRTGTDDPNPVNSVIPDSLNDTGINIDVTETSLNNVVNINHPIIISLTEFDPVVDFDGNISNDYDMFLDQGLLTQKLIKSSLYGAVRDIGNFDQGFLNDLESKYADFIDATDELLGVFENIDKLISDLETKLYNFNLDTNEIQSQNYNFFYNGNSQWKNSLRSFELLGNVNLNNDIRNIFRLINNNRALTSNRSRISNSRRLLETIYALELNYKYGYAKNSLSYAINGKKVYDKILSGEDQVNKSISQLVIGVPGDITILEQGSGTGEYRYNNAYSNLQLWNFIPGIGVENDDHINIINNQGEFVKPLLLNKLTQTKLITRKRPKRSDGALSLTLNQRAIGDFGFINIIPSISDIRRGPSNLSYDDIALISAMPLTNRVFLTSKCLSVSNDISQNNVITDSLISNANSLKNLIEINEPNHKIYPLDTQLSVSQLSSPTDNNLSSENYLELRKFYSRDNNGFLDFNFATGYFTKLNSMLSNVIRDATTHYGFDQSSNNHDNKTLSVDLYREIIAMSSYMIGRAKLGDHAARVSIWALSSLGNKLKRDIKSGYFKISSSLIKVIVDFLTIVHDLKKDKYNIDNNVPEEVLNLDDVSPTEIFLAKTIGSWLSGLRVGTGEQFLSRDIFVRSLAISRAFFASADLSDAYAFFNSIDASVEPALENITLMFERDQFITTTEDLTPFVNIIGDLPSNVKNMFGVQSNISSDNAYSFTNNLHYLYTRVFYAEFMLAGGIGYLKQHGKLSNIPENDVNITREIKIDKEPYYSNAITNILDIFDSVVPNSIFDEDESTKHLGYNKGALLTNIVTTFLNVFSDIDVNIDISPNIESAAELNGTFNIKFNNLESDYDNADVNSRYRSSYDLLSIAAAELQNDNSQLFTNEYALTGPSTLLAFLRRQFNINTNSPLSNLPSDNVLASESTLYNTSYINGFGNLETSKLLALKESINNMNHNTIYRDTKINDIGPIPEGLGISNAKLVLQLQIDNAQLEKLQKNLLHILLSHVRLPLSNKKIAEPRFNANQDMLYDTYKVLRSERDSVYRLTSMLAGYFFDLTIGMAPIAGTIQRNTEVLSTVRELSQTGVGRNINFNRTTLVHARRRHNNLLTSTNALHINAYVKKSDEITKTELAIMKEMLKTPILRTPRGDNISFMAVGVPKTLGEMNSVYKFKVYKTDQQYPGMKFKPVNYSFHPGIFIQDGLNNITFSDWDDLLEKRIYSYLPISSNNTTSLTEHLTRQTVILKNNSRMTVNSIQKYTKAELKELLNITDDVVFQNIAYSHFIKKYLQHTSSMIFNETEIYKNINLNEINISQSTRDLLSSISNSTNVDNSILNLNNVDSDVMGNMFYIQDGFEFPVTNNIYTMKDLIIINTLLKESTGQTDIITSELFKSLMSLPLMRLSANNELLMLELLSDSLFNQIQILPVDPDEFELATNSELSRDYRNLVTQRRISRDRTEIPAIIKDRPTSAGYYSMNSYFVTLSSSRFNLNEELV